MLGWVADVHDQKLVADSVARHKPDFDYLEHKEQERKEKIRKHLMGEEEEDTKQNASPDQPKQVSDLHALGRLSDGMIDSF
jgi:hypothetical protein